MIISLFVCSTPVYKCVRPSSCIVHSVRNTRGAAMQQQSAHTHPRDVSMCEVEVRDGGMSALVLVSDVTVPQLQHEGKRV